MAPVVLLVVQDPFFLHNLSERVRQLKASVFTAENRHEALEACSEHPVDVVLLDARQQQDNDMVQILGSLKQQHPEIEIILLSSPDNIGLAMEGMRAGASEDITVPFDMDHLRIKIQAAMQRKKSREKPRRKRSLMDAFEDVMMAATFAQAGEHEAAQELYSKRRDHGDDKPNE